jgi:hypothetical protein
MPAQTMLSRDGILRRLADCRKIIVTFETLFHGRDPLTLPGIIAAAAVI